MAEIIENWKEIEGYEGLYWVSDQGNVYSVYCKRNLKPRVMKSGKYLAVTLCKNGVHRECKVHSLVAQAFLEKPQDGKIYEVNHLDEDKTNNAVSNLQYMTHAENINYGTRNIRAGRTNGFPVYCYELDKYFYSISDAGRVINRSNANVADCCYGLVKNCAGYTFRFAKKEELEEYEEKIWEEEKGIN